MQVRKIPQVILTRSFRKLPAEKHLRQQVSYVKTTFLRVKVELLYLTHVLLVEVPSNLTKIITCCRKKESYIISKATFITKVEMFIDRY